MKGKHFIMHGSEVNRRRLIFQPYELDMLKYLYDHRLLRGQSQLYPLLTRYFGREITYRGFLVRIKKFREYNLIQCKEYSLGQDGFRLHIYSIAPRGVETLIETGYLKPDINPKYAAFFSQKKNLDHYLATQELVLHTLIREKEYQKKPLNQLSFTSLNPAFYARFSKKTNLKIITPDWIIKNGHRYLNIEMDTGSEDLMTIEDKVFRYSQLCEEYPDETHSLVVALLDDSFKTRRIYGSRVERVLNIKETLIEVWDRLKMTFACHVLPLSRTYECAYRLLEEGPPSLVNHVHKLKGIIPNINVNKYYNDHWEVVENSFSSIDGPDLLIRSQKTGHIYGMLYMQEGSVGDMYRLKRIVENKIKWQGYKVIAVYPSKDEMEHDILSRYFIRNDVIFTNLPELANIFAPLQLYRMIGVRKFGVIDLE